MAYCFGCCTSAADVVPTAINSLQEAAADGSHSVPNVKKNIKDNIVTDVLPQAEANNKKTKDMNYYNKIKKKEELKKSSGASCSMESEQTAGLGSRYFSMGFRPSPL